MLYETGNQIENWGPTAGRELAQNLVGDSSHIFVSFIIVSLSIYVGNSEMRQHVKRHFSFMYFHDYNQ